MARFPPCSHGTRARACILVGVEWRDNAWPLDRSLDELERLATQLVPGAWHACRSVW